MKGTRDEGGLIQAAENGQSIAYLASAPIVADPPANPTLTQVYSQRGPSGWSSQDIATPGEGFLRIGTGLSYQAFSTDLSTAVVEPAGEASPLSPENPLQPGQIAYSYDLQTGGYTPLVTKSATALEHISANYAGASQNGQHIAFTSTAPLTPEALPAEPEGQGGQPNLYEWTNGAIKLINILPSGSPTAGEAHLGNRRFALVRLWNTVSEDGSRVIWSSPDALYMRDTSAGQTIQLDAAQGGPESGDGVFEAASKDDSQIFLSDERKLTGDAASGPNLYEFDSTTGQLTDLTPASVAPAGTQLDYVLGASEDGSYIYYAARGVLAEGGVEGRENVYESHYDGARWETTFIAQLSLEERQDHFAEDLTARVSPDGHFLAFMSDEALTGYDNTDQLSGLPDQEVYLYDAESQQLSCASCNPSGERPRGEVLPTYASAINPYSTWSGRAVSAVVPGWTPDRLLKATYQPRYLSDSGKVFFDSVEALVSRDINGQVDVYEYEPSGVGSCELSTGCVALVSSGLGAVESTFLDASADGQDVFFMTRDQLVPEDFDESYDLYDAHECSAAVPCFAPPATVPPACTSSDACKAAPSPQPSTFGDPPSATFSGSENLVLATTPATATKKAKQKPKAKKKPKSKQKSKAKQPEKQRSDGTGHKRQGRLAGRSGK